MYMLVDVHFCVQISSWASYTGHSPDIQHFGITQTTHRNNASITDTDIQGTTQKDAGKSSHISQRRAEKIELHKQ